MADWGSLPGDLVRLIANKLSVIDDFTALTAVCRSYNSVVEKKQWRPHGCSTPPWLLLCCQGSYPPWLLLHCQGGDDGDDDEANNTPTISFRGFLNLYKNKKRFVMDLPEIHGRRCWGSPYGWIVTLGLDRQLHLFNPLNRRRILLPQTICNKDSRWMRKRHIDRALLIKRPPSSHSSSGFNDFLVLTISYYKVHVIRPHSWESVKLYYRDSHIYRNRIFDTALYKDQIYILGTDGYLFICSNFDGPDTPIATAYYDIDTSMLKVMNQRLYLVECLGELCMVSRVYDYRHYPMYNTSAFYAYKFNHGTKEWMELEDLGDCAIFVGGSQSVSLSQPETFGCRRNCIYFTDDNYDGFSDVRGHDMGIYDFDKMTVHPLYDGADSRSTYSTPTWLLPSFN